MQHRYLLVIVDLFSKYIELVAMKNQEASTIKDTLIDQCIYRHGNPKIAVSDQARNINGVVVSALCTELGIEKRRSSPYHPEGDGQVERSIQTVKAILRCIMHEEEKASYMAKSFARSSFQGKYSYQCKY